MPTGRLTGKPAPDVIAGGTGGAGLGTRPARYALVVVWALGLANGVITGQAGRPADLLTYLIVLVGAVVLTGRGDDVLPRSSAALVVAASGLTVALVLVTVPITAVPWLVNLASYLVALLIARGNGTAGAIGAAVLLTVVLIAAVSGSADPVAVARLLWVPALAMVAGIVWRLILEQIVRRERAHRSQAARAARDIRIAREAAERYRAELDTIRDQAGPLLRSIADGGLLDAEHHRRLTVVEAAIRDRIRSPGLAHPELIAAVADRRRNGVRVLLLGAADDPAGGTDEPPGDALAAAIGAVIAPVTEGSITIRAIPPGRHGAVSVLIAGPSTTQRSLLAADGSVLDRR